MSFGHVPSSVRLATVRPSYSCCLFCVVGSPNTKYAGERTRTADHHDSFRGGLYSSGDSCTLKDLTQLDTAQETGSKMGLAVLCV